MAYAFSARTDNNGLPGLNLASYLVLAVATNLYICVALYHIANIKVRQ